MPRYRVCLPRLVWLLSVIQFGGCASLPKEHGLAEAQELASQRLGKQMQWRDRTTDERAVTETVRALLREPLTIDSAVQIALLNNRSLQAAYAQLGIDRADLVQALLLQNPRFSGSIGLSGGAIGEWEATLLGNFLNLLTWAVRKQVQTAGFEQKRLELTRQILDLAAQTRATYYALVAEMQTLELWRTAATAIEAAAELAARQYQAGTLDRLEQSMHQSLYAETLLEVARAEEQLRQNREKLNRLLGLWGEQTSWKPVSRLPEAPSSLPAIEHLEARAVERNLGLLAAKKEVEVLTATLDLSRRYRFLGLIGLGFHSHREPDGQFTGPNLELELPLFDQGQARLARQEAELWQSEARLAALAIDLRSEIREVHAKAVGAHERVNYYRTVLLPLRQTILDETQRRYNAMLVGVYELLLAKQKEIGTGRDYIAALRDFWLAWSDLERLLGEPIPLSTARLPVESKEKPARAPMHHPDQRNSEEKEYGYPS